MSNSYSLLIAQTSSFLILPLPLAQLFTLQHLCDLWVAMPVHWSPSASHLNPCWEKQRISLGVASISSMCLTYLIYFSPKGITFVGSVHVLGMPMEHYIKPLAGFEPSILLIALFVVRHLSYPLSYTTS